MNIIYNNAKVKGYCTSMKKAQKAFNSQVALKLHAAINQIEAASGMSSISLPIIFTC